jgi:cation diffusion facilitator family transporter
VRGKLMDRELIRSKKARKVTLIGFFVNALLTVFKLAAGIVGKSGAMIADAVHSLSDFLTDIVVLVGFKFTAKPEDKCHNYGHGKYETIATVIISAALALVGYQILRSGIINVVHVIKGGVLPKPGIIALVAAVVSIISKELLYRYSIVVGKKINSSAVIANAWHHRSDALSSIGAMLGIGGAIILGEKWTILDPIASIVVSIFIFKVSYDIFIPSLNELVEKTLSGKEREKVEVILKRTEAILGYHKLRMRRVGNTVVIECHIMIDKSLNIQEGHNIAVGLEYKIKNSFIENSIITIHIEPFLDEETSNEA